MNYFKQNDIIVMVAEPVFISKLFVKDLDDIPAIDPAIRENIIKNYEERWFELVAKRNRKKRS